MADIDHPLLANDMTSTCSSCESIGLGLLLDGLMKLHQLGVPPRFRHFAGPVAPSGAEHFQRAGLGTFTRAPPPPRTPTDLAPASSVPGPNTPAAASAWRS